MLYTLSMLVRTNVPLAPLTTLRLGGAAARMVELEREEDVVDAVRDAEARGEALFVLGGNSDYVGEADKAEIHRLFPSAQFTTIGGAGHWVHVEKPAEFAAEVTEFLE